MRNIKKNADEARKLLERLRKDRREIDITGREVLDILQRIDASREAALDAIYDCWLFGLAVGYRAGLRDAKRQKK
jgi:hypothetical protein